MIQPKTAPSAAGVGNHVFVAIKGLDARVFGNQTDLGQPFGQWFPRFGQFSLVALGVIKTRISR
jgi:hypothetical protein